jgi:hypothetical protein
MEEAYISAREMAVLLGVSRTTALRYASDPASNIRSHLDGNRRLYDRGDVEVFVARRQEGNGDVSSDDAPMTSADDYEEKREAMTPTDEERPETSAIGDAMGTPEAPLDSDEATRPEQVAIADAVGTLEDMTPNEIIGAPRSLEDDAVLDLPDAPEATRSDDDGAQPVLDDEILTSLDLMESGDGMGDGELVLDDILLSADDTDLQEAARLDDAPTMVPASDLVALVREQQERLIAAERRISELETQLESRLDAEAERGLRDEVALYKSLVDGGKTKKKKNKKDKKPKAENKIS